MKTSIIGTGLSGLVGSKLVTDFEASYDFQNLDVTHPTKPVDITNLEQLRQVFTASEAPVVVHFAAFTDVNKAWEDRDNKEGIVYKVNVTGTENIARAAKETNKHLIHISTAYVFDGKKSESYTEEDQMSPIEWYGQTKSWAEEKVMKVGGSWTILRIDQPFRSDSFPKKDIAHRIIAGLQDKTLYPLFTDHFFGPTYINDFAKVIDWVIRTKTAGLFHASSGERWTDYDFASLISQTLNLPGELQVGDLDEYLRTLTRPYQRNTALNTTKLFAKLDFQPKSIKRAIAEITDF